MSIPIILTFEVGNSSQRNEKPFHMYAVRERKKSPKYQEMFYTNSILVTRANTQMTPVGMQIED